MTRVYITTNPHARVRAIVDTSSAIRRWPHQNELLVSIDGNTYYTALFYLQHGGDDGYRGTLSQPALGINEVPIEFDGTSLRCGDVLYELDESATVDTIVTKPIMEVFQLYRTYAGYYVTAQNKLDSRSYFFLNGQRLKIVSSMRARQDDSNVVEDASYEGDHRFLVTGDHMNVDDQSATFDSYPATRLDPGDYEVVFADDLTTVAVIAK